MKKLEVLVDGLGFGLGYKITLDTKLAEDHKKSLKPLGENTYEVVAPINFKRGDHVGVSDQVPMAYFKEVEDKPKTKAKKDT